jgi:hypothetical protein
METANKGLCEAQRAAGDHTLQVLADPCQSLRVQATSYGDDNAPFPIQSATEQHARGNSGKKSERFTDFELNCGDVNMETPTRDEPDDTGATLLATANVLTEQTPEQGATAREPIQALTMEEFFRSVELICSMLMVTSRIKFTTLSRDPPYI